MNTALRVGLALLGGVGVTTGASGQTVHRPHLEGQWEAKVSDGLHYVMVRGDSSAQFGEQVARWRMVGDSLWFTLGDGAWQVYGMKVAGEKLTLSGGDLDKPVTLRRVGPPTPRPAGLVVPAAPPDTARAWD
ncbi:MAG TPA: hypothetical protein VNX15_00680 [Gemmatimonadales bacterium]|nr:hypothetical protein [Gemmatimonadales bacterium]